MRELGYSYELRVLLSFDCDGLPDLASPKTKTGLPASARVPVVNSQLKVGAEAGSLGAGPGTTPVLRWPQRARSSRYS